MQTSLQRIAEKSALQKEHRFQNLMILLTAGFLHWCWRKLNKKSAPGVDRVTAWQYKENLEGNIAKLAESVKGGWYRAKLVLRRFISKGGGRLRPLGIPATSDKLLQRAVTMILEAIYESIFLTCSFGYRPHIGALDAIKELSYQLQFRGYNYVVEADIRSFFDNINHDLLMEMLSKKINDKPFLRLIRKWLKAGVLEEGKVINPVTGTPQGGIISPILANIYLHYVLDEWFEEVVKAYCRGDVYLCRYADDFVLMAEKIPEECLVYMKWMFSRMKLKLNEEKSRLVCAHEESFDFLGHTFRYSDDLYGRPFKYWNVEPSKKSQKKVRSNIREYLSKNGHKAPQTLVDELNAKLRGWINYYTIKGVTYPNKAKRDLRYYLSKKLQRYYKRKSQRKSKLYNRGAMRVLVNKYGLVDPTKYALR